MRSINNQNVNNIRQELIPLAIRILSIIAILLLEKTQNDE